MRFLLSHACRAVLLTVTSLVLSCQPGAQSKIKPMHTNALIHEASPYLQQHAHNPVNWLPWSDAAFEQARRESKPVFLSIGYAACHWCHVMERESFENNSIAAFLNENFVAIKVDREERPDVDHHYMDAVQRMTGQGGWPLSAFLTPDRKPFFGGTYWPPYSKYGRPGFLDVLKQIAQAWTQKRDEIISSAEKFHTILSDSSLVATRSGEISVNLLIAAVRASERAFDGVHGGFGGAPKFPHAMELNLLQRLSVRLSSPRAQEMAVFTLRRMARGGIYDQLGGGFHRYSTDARWLIPHFEKMLYDNALLVPVYLDAYVLTGDTEFRRIAQQSLEWALREMSVPEGGFASSLDADSEGKEGKFYVWSPSEIEAVLGPERGHRFCRVYDVSDSGNFEGGHSALNLPESLDLWAERFGISHDQLDRELMKDRAKLLATRSKRVRPARDDKVLTDWNGLMISALVRGFAILDESKYLEAAQHTANRLLTPFETSGVLVHSFLGKRTLSNQLLLDYASLGNGLLDLFLADGDLRWLSGSITLARRMDSLFTGTDSLYVMSADKIAGASPVDPLDSAMPSGNSLAGMLMARLCQLTGDEWYEERAERQVKPLAGMMQGTPGAFSQAMVTVELLTHAPAQLVLIGDAERVLWKAAHSVYCPALQVIWNAADSLKPSSELSSLLEGKTAIGGQPTAYLCRNFVCEMPVTDANELRENLMGFAQAQVEAAPD